MPHQIIQHNKFSCNIYLCKEKLGARRKDDEKSFQADTKSVVINFNR